MLVDGGFVTNYKAHKDQNKTKLATGHDQLSESAGLWLQNLALTGTQRQFDAFYKETKKKFYADGQFTYRINADGKRADVNASIDDMWIISALIEAEQRFKDPKYQKEIKSLVSTFKKQSIQNGVLVDFYDVKTKKPAYQISLYYLDIKDMGYIYKVAGLSPKDLEFEYHILKTGIFQIRSRFITPGITMTPENTRIVSKSTLLNRCCQFCTYQKLVRKNHKVFNL